MCSKEIHNGRGKFSTNGVRHCSRSLICCVNIDAAVWKTRTF